MMWVAVLVAAVLAAWAFRKRLLVKEDGGTLPAEERLLSPEQAPARERGERPAPIAAGSFPHITYEEDEEATYVGKGGDAAASSSRQRVPVCFDVDAAEDEKTKAAAIILTSASARSDRGKRRKKNEDSVLLLDDHGVYAVADGMGGYAGGEIASALAVDALRKAFLSGEHANAVDDELPRRAAELVAAIRAANTAVHERASRDVKLRSMGTTLCAARFSRDKQRMYVGHVGDSRCYRWRDGALSQMTSDHTMKELGVVGDDAKNLSRALGIWDDVPVDIILAKPIPGDTYLLCSDGLTKMVLDADIGARLGDDAASPLDIATGLVDLANANGGADNVSVIVVRVTLAQATP